LNNNNNNSRKRNKKKANNITTNKILKKIKFKFKDDIKTKNEPEPKDLTKDLRKNLSKETITNTIVNENTNGMANANGIVNTIESTNDKPIKLKNNIKIKNNKKKNNKKKNKDLKNKLKKQNHNNSEENEEEGSQSSIHSSQNSSAQDSSTSIKRKERGLSNLPGFSSQLGSRQWKLINQDDTDPNTTYNSYLQLEKKYPMPSYADLPQKALVNKEPYQLFELFFNDQFFNDFATSTNKAIEKKWGKYNSRKIITTRNEIKTLETRIVTKNEMKVFLGIILYMNFNHLRNYLEHWLENEVKNSFIRYYMSRNRFCFIRSNFSVEKASDTSDKTDKMYFIRDYINDLIKLWQKYYYPGRDLCIDETVIPFTGRGKEVNFLVYLKNKPIPAGFLLYGLCDSLNGYILQNEIFTGNYQKSRIQKSVTSSRMIRLLENYFFKGHIVFADNFYTTMEVVQYLSERDTGYVGTLRRGRADEIGLDKEIKKDEVRYFEHIEQPHIMLTIWFDSIIVKTLSNCMKPETVQYKIRLCSLNITYKSSPLVFKEYNKKARGIDLNNHLISLYSNLNRFDTWWMHIFFYYVNITITNAYIIYKYNILRKYKELGRIKNRNFGLTIPRKQFILSIIRKLINSDGGSRVVDLNKYMKSFQRTESSHYLQKGVCAKIKCMKCKKTSVDVYNCYGCYDGVKTANFCPTCFENYHKGLFK